ncbi:MAG TPA: MBL fold metallo-hydrolase [Steroidobacteraceae bacterium]|nr:MBL fold metallo-hydrolase [Steroidobacteraceae bacterium]
MTGTLAAIAAAKYAHAAAKTPFTVPEVDSLTLQVIVDNATFGPFLPDENLPGLRVERNSGRPAPRMSRHALMGEFGLSLLARSTLGSQTRSVMVDFGYSPEVMANNLSLLGIDTRELNAAVLSHGHLDHYGGFPAVFGSNVPAKHLPLFVGGEETFCERVAMIGNPPPVMGTLDRKELAQAGLDVKIAAEPAVVADHAFTTGLIPLETFERAAIPTQMRPGVGCDAAALSEAKRKQTQVVDDGEHELATCYSVKGLGLVVVASCSHRGVLNSVRRAQAISGVQKVHTVVGGFHLVRPRTEDEARRTVAEFVKIDPTYIVPMHCTGEVFIAEALRVMPGKIIRPYVGNRFTFAAA